MNAHKGFNVEYVGTIRTKNTDGKEHWNFNEYPLQTLPLLWSIGGSNP